jgi:hypothetical protein
MSVLFADGEVVRVSDDNGSHIEPEYDQGWDAFSKLRWAAAVCRCDTGIDVKVHEFPNNWCLEVRGRDGFSVSVALASWQSVWDYLAGMSVAAKVLGR